jgi:hypothetical protein
MYDRWPRPIEMGNVGTACPVTGIAADPLSGSGALSIRMHLPLSTWPENAAYLECGAGPFSFFEIRVAIKTRGAR